MLNAIIYRYIKDITTQHQKQHLRVGVFNQLIVSLIQVAPPYFCPFSICLPSVLLFFGSYLDTCPAIINRNIKNTTASNSRNYIR